MKGDFSRDTFDPRKHYARVLMQQGRVQTDADWNEQAAIQAHRDTVTANDVIGACGAPVHNAGFGITTDGKTLTIGAGRFYADGILVENEAPVPYDTQPDLPGARDVLEQLQEADTTGGLVYLDVWERHITALDDPLIREVALGGPDTTTRGKIVWQVRVLPVKGQPEDTENCAELRATENNLRETLKKLQEANASAARIAAAQAKLDDVSKRLAQECGGGSCEAAFPEWSALTAPRDALLNARTVPPGDENNPCLLPPSAGYQRLENQLYRVEIHDGGAFKTGDKTATFKASRDNGTVVTLIEKIDGQEVTVRDVGPDDVLGLANGQWVEVTDDALELESLPGELIQIEEVNAATRLVKLKSAPGLDFDAARHPKLRRWDTAGALPVQSDWVELEGGIQIQFGEGTYRTGDYWQIPARTATGEIEWEPFAIPNTAPVAQPPRGIVHHYCRLALVRLRRERLEVADDCRVLFPPLTEVGGGQVVDAFQITGTNWLNDELFDFDRFFKEGLVVETNAPADPRSTDAANFIVTVEFTTAGDAAPAATLSPLVVLDGQIVGTFGGQNVIVWRPTPILRERLAPLFERAAARMRVKLMGRTIWSEEGGTRRYLDGQAFGVPVGGAAERKTRIGLQFPSGNGTRGSDFESWFYLAREVPPVRTLQVTQVTFLNAAGGLSSAGVLNLPPVPADVGFRAGENVNVIQVQFSRAVRREGLATGAAATSVRVERVLARAAGRVAGEVKLVDERTAQFLARDPQVFTQGNYRLVVLGEDQTDAPGVRAVDDGQLLDGNYDNAAGQNFVMAFAAR
jgi:hypothetical protein